MVILFSVSVFLEYSTTGDRIGDRELFSVTLGDSAGSVLFLSGQCFLLYVI